MWKLPWRRQRLLWTSGGTGWDTSGSLPTCLKLWLWLVGKIQSDARPLIPCWKLQNVQDQLWYKLTRLCGSLKSFWSALQQHHCTKHSFKLKNWQSAQLQTKRKGWLWKSVYTVKLYLTKIHGVDLCISTFQSSQHNKYCIYCTALQSPGSSGQP